MNLRGRAPLHHPGIQLAPLVDVLLLLLIFFLLTWNAARTENELDVKVPKASAAKEKEAAIGGGRADANGGRGEGSADWTCSRQRQGRRQRSCEPPHAHRCRAPGITQRHGPTE